MSKGIGTLFWTLIFVCLLPLTSSASDYERAFAALERKDFKKAAYYLSYFASNGDDVAQYNMGILYRDDLGVEKNNKVALSWFLLSAEQNHMLANYAIAKLIEDKEGLYQFERDAIDFYKEAAFLGHAIAPLEIGNFYFSRKQVPEDLVRAFIWWSLSFERGAPNVYENISRITPTLSKSQMDSIVLKLAECDNSTLRVCLANF